MLFLPLLAHPMRETPYFIFTILYQYISRKIFFTYSLFKKFFSGTSLVIQLLRIRMPKQETQVQSLVRELRSHRLRGSYAWVLLSSCFATRETTTVRSLSATARGQPLLATTGKDCTPNRHEQSQERVSVSTALSHAGTAGY